MLRPHHVLLQPHVMAVLQPPHLGQGVSTDGQAGICVLAVEADSLEEGKGQGGFRIKLPG